MQLVAYGAQDIYLTGNPQITFFKSLFKSYSNFYITKIEQQINGTPNFGNTIDCVLSKSGDLLKNIYLDITLPDLNKPTTASWYGYTNNIGCNIIDSISLKINDLIIDKIYGESIDIYNNIYGIDESDLLLEYESEFSIRNRYNTIPIEKRHCYIKLPFWFSKSTGSALPLIALNNSNITISIEFKKFIDVIKIDTYNNLNSVTIKSDSNFDCKIFTESIYLDEKEQKFFSTKPHEYLIEQLQYNGQEILNTQTNKVRLNFNHPVKELLWVVQPISNIDLSYTNNLGGPQFYNYTDSIDTTYFSGTPNDPMGGGMSGGNSNNISWGLPVSNNGANVNISGNSLITPLSGQNNNLQLKLL